MQLHFASDLLWSLGSCWMPHLEEQHIKCYLFFYSQYELNQISLKSSREHFHSKGTSCSLEVLLTSTLMLMATYYYVSNMSSPPKNNNNRQTIFRYWKEVISAKRISCFGRDCSHKADKRSETWESKICNCLPSIEFYKCLPSMHLPGVSIFVLSFKAIFIFLYASCTCYKRS